MSYLKYQSNNIYYIGGSPCSGKSTVAESLAKKYGLYYFKVDDFLDDYLKKGKSQTKPICTKLSDMTGEQIWMRAPEIQNIEELQFYREIFEYIMEDLSKINSAIITEGASYLPELVHEIGVDKNHYINITPTPDFQYTHYKERPWVPHILKDCSDKDKAFDNWMKRDALFAEYVRNQARELGYKTLVTDGASSYDEVFQIVSQVLNLEK
ncbi:hypothetical protein HNQ56_004844 [Anaerotaenia torta]|uniref:hypothetical protein n=1 Tax=Anaerotaenia torta TaxID=433293 RepID=UPI003D226CB7